MEFTRFKKGMFEKDYQLKCEYRKLSSRYEKLRKSLHKKIEERKRKQSK